MRAMKHTRTKAALLFALFAAAAALAALAFADNVSVVARWWAAFAAADGVATDMPGRIGGFLPWMDWAAVDHSCATTFIPLLGFLLAARGAWRVLRGRPADPEYFPCFRSFDQLVVALGLIGTLWGIILIGWYDLESVSMRDLMVCLHTALFSTLMAVVWVFLVDRPLVRPYFTRLLEQSGLAETDDGDLAGAVDRLVERLGAASDAFDRRQTEYEAAFTKRQKEFEETSARRHAEFEETFANRLAEFEASFARRHAAYERDFDARQKEYVEFFRRRIDELERRAEGAEEKLKKVAEAVIG